MRSGFIAVVVSVVAICAYRMWVQRSMEPTACDLLSIRPADLPIAATDLEAIYRQRINSVLTEVASDSLIASQTTNRAPPPSTAVVDALTAARDLLQIESDRIRQSVTMEVGAPPSFVCTRWVELDLLRTAIRDVWGSVRRVSSLLYDAFRTRKVTPTAGSLFRAVRIAFYVSLPVFVLAFQPLIVAAFTYIVFAAVATFARCRHFIVSGSFGLSDEYEPPIAVQRFVSVPSRSGDATASDLETIIHTRNALYEQAVSLRQSELAGGNSASLADPPFASSSELDSFDVLPASAYRPSPSPPLPSSSPAPTSAYGEQFAPDSESSHRRRNGTRRRRRTRTCNSIVSHIPT